MLFPSYESMRKDEEMGTTNGFLSTKPTFCIPYKRYMKAYIYTNIKI